MRVTQGVLNAQINQSAQANRSGDAGLALNARFTAKVLDLQNGLLTLDMGGGKTLEAKDQTGLSLSKGQTVTFQVSEVSKEGQVSLRVAEPLANKGEESVSNLLIKLKLPDTEENRQIVKSFVSQQLPVTPENVKAAIDMKAQLQTLEKLVSSGMPVPTEPNQPTGLKETVVKMLQLPVSTDTTSEPEPTGEIKAPVTTVQSPKGNQEGLSGSKSSVNPEVSQAIPLKEDGVKPLAIQKSVDPSSIKQPAEEGQDAPVLKPQVAVSGQGAVPESSKSPSNPTSPFQGLKEMLGNLSVDKIVFVLKNGLPKDLETLGSMDKLLSGKLQLSQEVGALLKVLPDQPAAAPLKETLKNLIHALNQEAFEDPIQLRDQLKTALHDLKQSASVIQQSTKLDLPTEKLSEVKNSLEFLFKLNESLTYLHVPVALPNGTGNMDLYVQREKSGKRQINPLDTRIFISLDTHSLERVQCLAEIKGEKLSLDFKVTESSVQSLFMDHMNELKEPLETMGYSNISIQCQVTQRSLNLMDMVQTEGAYNDSFDFWV